MRDIKFRFYNIKNKSMFSWNEFLSWEKSEKNLFKSTENWKVMQYTGLKYENGVEIYEGDIVEYLGTRIAIYQGQIDMPYEKTMVIKWDTNNEHGIIGFPVPYTYETVYVIGNIYENPNLIK